MWLFPPREECYVCRVCTGPRSPCVCETLFVCNACLQRLGPRCAVCQTDYVCRVKSGVRWRCCEGCNCHCFCVALLLTFMFSVLALAVGCFCFVIVHGPSTAPRHHNVTNTTTWDVRAPLGFSFLYGVVFLLSVFLVTLCCTHCCCVKRNILPC